jgi:hypothetical protein
VYLIHLHRKLRNQASLDEDTVTTAPQLPTTRRALASLALLSVVSTLESRRRSAAKADELEVNQGSDMSGELQTIPARHGVATFVPRGRTIKIINTYGKQVVSMWAFTLGAPPEEGDDEASVEDIEKEAQDVKRTAEEETEGEKASSDPAKEESAQKPADETADKESTSNQNDAAEDPPEQAPDTPDAPDGEKPTEAPTKQSKRTWASYLPSIPYRNKGSANKPGAEQKPDAETEKARNEANTKKWSSYLPTGKGISNYVPNVQVPDTKDVVSAFKSSHHRDPNKSYAEQLYDFSKTPVGAGTIAGEWSL